MPNSLDSFDPFAPQAKSLDDFDPFAQPAAPTQATPATPAIARPETGDFMRGMQRVLPEAKQLVGGTMAAIGDRTGWDGLRDKGLEIYKEQESKIAPLQRPTDSATEAWKQVKGGNLGAGVDFLQNAAGYTAGQALESLAAAGVGAAIGGIATPEVGGVGAIPGAIGGFVARQGIKRAVKSEAEKIVAEQVAKGVAKSEAKKQAAGYVAENTAKDAVAKQVAEKYTEAQLRKMGGRAAGAAAGAQGMNTVMELGSVYPEAYQKAQDEGREMTGDEKNKAIGASLAAAGLESAADLFNLGVLFRGAKGAARDTAERGLKKALKEYGKRAAVAGTEGAMREAGTEGAQTFLERLGASQSLNDADAWRDYIDSAAVGAVGGVLFGGAAAIRQEQQGEAPKFGGDTLDKARADYIEAANSGDPAKAKQAAQAVADELFRQGRASYDQPGDPPGLPAPDGTQSYGTIEVGPDGVARKTMPDGVLNAADAPVAQPTIPGNRAGTDSQNQRAGVSFDDAPTRTPSEMAADALRIQAAEAAATDKAGIKKVAAMALNMQADAIEQSNPFGYQPPTFGYEAPTFPAAPNDGRTRLAKIAQANGIDPRVALAADDSEAGDLDQLDDRILSDYARYLWDDVQAGRRVVPGFNPDDASGPVQERPGVDSVGLRGDAVPVPSGGQDQAGGVSGQADAGAPIVAGQAPVQGAAAGAQAQGVNPDAPGATLTNGFKRGEGPGRRYRVSSSNMGVSLEKRNDESGSASAFFIGKDGALIDGDTIVRNNAADVDRLWTPPSDEARVEAESILDEMGKLKLSDPKRAALKERLRGVVTGKGSSRDNPLPNDREGDAPVGAWVAGPKIPGATPDQTVKQVMDVPIDQIDATEFDSAGNIAPEKRADASRYAEAMRNGEQFPNARGSVLPNGKIKLQDGHRRLAAAIENGATTLRVAVNPMPSTSGQAPQAQAEESPQAPTAGERAPAQSSPQQAPQDAAGNTPLPANPTATSSASTPQIETSVSQESQAAPSPQGTPVEGGGQPIQEAIDSDPVLASNRDRAVRAATMDEGAFVAAEVADAATKAAQAGAEAKAANELRIDYDARLKTHVAATRKFRLKNASLRKNTPEALVAAESALREEGRNLRRREEMAAFDLQQAKGVTESSMRAMYGRLRERLAVKPQERVPKKPRSAMNDKEMRAADLAKAYGSLVNLKSTKLLSDSNGRKLYEVKVSADFSRKWSPGMGRSWPEVGGFELKEKSEVTGRPQDDGYILIDAREQTAARIAAQPKPEAPRPAPAVDPDSPQGRAAAREANVPADLIAKRDAANERLNAASAVMQKFPTGEMGLTPDAVKATPEWKAARKEMDRAMTALRNANAAVVKARKAKPAAPATADAIQRKADEVMEVVREGSINLTRDQVVALIQEKGIEAADKTISGFRASRKKQADDIAKYEAAKEKAAKKPRSAMTNKELREAEAARKENKEADKEQEAQKAPQKAEPFEHNGTRIYPAQIKGLGMRWAVQAGDKPATGDSLHETKESATKAADVERRQAEQKRASDAAQQAESEARAQADAARKADDLNGFTAGMTPMQAGKVKVALDKLVRFDGVVMSLRKRVESLSEAGTLAVETFEEPVVQPMSRARYNRATQREQDAHEAKMKAAGNKTVYLVNEYDIGKTAYDYAQHLLAKKPAASAAQEKGRVEYPSQSTKKPALDKFMRDVVDYMNGDIDRAQLGERARNAVKAGLARGEITGATQRLGDWLEGDTNDVMADKPLRERAAVPESTQADVDSAIAAIKAARAKERAAQEDQSPTPSQQQADSKYAKYDEAAKAYGRSVREDGAILKGGKESGLFVREKGKRLRIEDKDGNLTYSGAPNGEALGKFMESFWFAEKKPAPTTDRKEAGGTESDMGWLDALMAEDTPEYRAGIAKLQQRVDDARDVAVATMQRRADEFDAAAKEILDRQYKGNTKSVQFSGDGPLRDGRTSVGAINESRKRKNAAGQRAAAKMLRKAATRMQADPIAFAESLEKFVQRLRENGTGRGVEDYGLREMLLNESDALDMGGMFGPTSPGGVIRAAVATFRAGMESAVSGKEAADVLESVEADEPFFSAALRAVEEGKGAPKRGTYGDWRGWLDGAVRRGDMKQSERDWLGIDAFLAGRDSTTRQELADFIRANEVKVEEVTLGNAEPLPEADWDRYQELSFVEDRTPDQQREFDALHRRAGEVPGGGRDPKFASYQLPGGENYRELLLTLPSQSRQFLNREGDLGKGITFREELKDAFYNKALIYSRDQASMYVAGALEGFAEPTALVRKILGDQADALIARARKAEQSDREKQAKYSEAMRAEYRSSHFDQPNILAHVRFNERTDADGKRVLFIEEIQSDWHQAGRKRGYQSGDMLIDGKTAEQWQDEAARQFDAGDMAGMQEASRNARTLRDRATERGFAHGQAVPDAPFKATDEWAMLAFKRMVRHAAENGFDRIAWTTGEIQAERYDLSKQIEGVDWDKATNRLFVREKGAGEFVWKKVADDATESKLSDYIGKDVAEKLAASQPDKDGHRSLTGQDLKVGGEGMKGFYDKILPSAVNKWAKKFGGKVGQAVIGVPQSDGRAAITRPHAIDLTPQMRDAALQGMPLFQIEAGELSESDLTPTEKASLARQRYGFNGPDGANKTDTERAAFAVLNREVSRAEGLEDADKLKLREAVNRAIGTIHGFPPITAVYLRGVAGLHGIVREGYIQRLQDQQARRGGTAKTAGLYLSANDTVDGKPRFVLFTDVVRSPLMAAFTAAHEVAGHHGLRSLLGDRLNRVLELADQNPTVKAVADAMMASRKLNANQRLLAIEEALADLAAAVRTGNFQRIKDKHGVEVPKVMQSRVRSMLDTLIQRIRELFRRKDVRFSDGQVRQLLEASWQAAQGQSASMSIIGPNGALEQVVFHGTPHSVDRFSLQKIGTGEGAQAYGWGLYFASNKEIAEHYRKNLTLARPKIILTQPKNGAKIGLDSFFDSSGEVGRPSAGLLESPRDRFALMLQAGNDLQGIIEESAARINREGLGARRSYWSSIREAAVLIRDAGLVPTVEQGNLYRVDVPEDADLLDWDKPLSEQPEKVRARLETLADSLVGANARTDAGGIPFSVVLARHSREAVARLTALREAWHQSETDYADSAFDESATRESRNILRAKMDRAADEYEAAISSSSPESYRLRDDVTGRHLYEALSEKNGPQAASEALNAAGIPGLRYLDAGSRSPDRGDKQLVAAMEAHPDDREAALNMAMRGVYNTPKEKAKIRETYAKRMTQLEKRHNYVIWDESAIGQPQSALESTEDQTQSEAFRNWFGKSVVTEDGKAGGKPLVVYHGGAGGVRVFEPERAGSVKTADWGSGVYFTPAKWQAQSYMEDSNKAADGKSNALWEKMEATAARHGTGVMYASMDLSSKKITQEQYDEIKAIESEWRKAREDAEKNGSGEVYAVYLRIENPLIQQYDGITDPYLREHAEAKGHDGIIIVHDDGSFDEIVAFRPEQIKSATANSGNFNPDNPSILESVESVGDALAGAMNSVRDVKLPAGYLLSDLFGRQEGAKSLSWWDVTIGTQFNLAKKSPLFKRVFDSVQNMVADISHYANAAMDLAPDVLPKFDTIKDAIKKQAMPAKDAKVVSSAVFDGTLKWARDSNGDVVKATELNSGIVWTADELRSRFGATDQQIEGYRQVRAAIDRSLDDTATTQMIRHAGEDGNPVREQMLAAPTAQAAADILSKHLAEQVKLMQDDGRSKGLLETAEQVQQIAKQIDKLKSKGYAPLSRFGRFTVYKDGENPVFLMFETQREANRAARMMREKGDKGIKQGTMSQEQFKLFKGMTPETLELFGEMLGLDKTGSEQDDLVYQAFLKAAKSNRSALKRLIHRQGIEGYSEDVSRVLASFLYSNARLAATNLHAPETQRAINDIPKEQGDLKDAAIKLNEYIVNPDDAGAFLSSFNFAQYLGGSIASAMVNMTQPLTMSFPWLSQYGGAWKAAKALGDAVKLVGKGGDTGNHLLDEALKRADADGHTQPQEVHQLQALASGKGALRTGDGTKAGDALAAAMNKYSSLVHLWGIPFSLAEQFNRRTTFIAAFNMATEQGMADPYGFAVSAVQTTQGIYNKANKPTWARNAIGGMAFTFKTYSINYVEMLHRMWTQGGKEGKKGVLLAAATMFLLAGAGGLPGADDLDDLIDGLMQRLGYNFSSKQEREEFFASLLGEQGAAFMEHGLSAVPGMPIDVSGRLGMGNLIPSTGLLVRKDDHTRDVAELAGPTGDFLKRSFESAGQLAEGNLGASMLAIAPRAVANAWKGVEMAETGEYRDTRGRKVLETTGLEAASKFIGFQPASVAKVQQSSGKAIELLSNYRLVSADIADRWAKGIHDQDPGEVLLAQKELTDWNAKNPDMPIRINRNSLRSRVRNLGMDRRERLSRATPKAVRQQVETMFDTTTGRSRLQDRLNTEETE